MLQIRRLLQLLEKGTSKWKIALLLFSGRHTVDNFVGRTFGSGMDISSLLALSDTVLSELLHPSKAEEKADPRLEELLTMCKDYQQELRKTGVTNHLLWQEYRQEVADGYAYSQFCEHLKSYAGRNGATMPFTHRPGEFLQIDFAGKKLSYVDTSTGELMAVRYWFACSLVAAIPMWRCYTRPGRNIYFILWAVAWVF